MHYNCIIIMYPTSKDDCHKLLDLYILCNTSKDSDVKRICNNLQDKLKKINNTKTLLELFIDCNNIIEKRNK